MKTRIKTTIVLVLMLLSIFCYGQDKATTYVENEFIIWLEQGVDAAIFATNSNVGHGGTYAQPHGGEFAIVARNWLDWQLKGDQTAAKMFVGKKCGLSTRAGWTIEKNKKSK